MISGATDRADRLRRSLRRLGYDLKAGERRGRFHITQDGSTVETSGDLFGLDLGGVEEWIRGRAKKR